MRPSLALCMIVRNEAHNLGGLLQSVRGCFDQIHITDTGSTDNTVEFLETINKHIVEGQPNWEGLPEIHIHHFDWVHDFSAARRYSFSHATTDYIFWMDGDDLLSDNKAFIRWRDNTMHAAHYWTAVYNYAFNEHGQIVCKFIRERVIKNNFGFDWEYFVHEGLIQKEGKKFWPQRVASWTVNHRRSKEDQALDHNRNLNLFASKPYAELPPRMLFYYGKEMVENGKQKEGGKPLMDAITSGKLDIHDMVLAMQFAAQSAISAQAWTQAIDILMNGLRLIPGRAEFWCMLADVYLNTGAFPEAIQGYEFALKCKQNDLGGIVVCYDHAYFEYPQTQLCKILIQTAQYAKAKEHASALEQKGFVIGREMLREIDRLQELNTIPAGLPKSDDIIITCQPGGPVTDWDEHTLAEKGHGGSETAAIEVARLLAQKTKRKVKIFHQRFKKDIMPSGVEYIPANELSGYIRNVEPYAHIAWRHSVPITKAKTYVWCHDLQCPGGANHNNYDKIVALSEFHREYLIETNGIPEEKIVLGHNGITPSEIVIGQEKDPLKVIFSSSPDRGLVQAIDIVKKAREISGLDIKLHCFYGFDNMRKGGQGEWADRIEAHVKAHPFVTHHGHVNKKVLYGHFADAAVWLYVNDFIESSCITALEAMYSGCWSIVRDMGALKYTMKDAIAQDMCDFMTVEVVNEATTGLWANRLVDAMLDKKWKRVDLPIKRTWETVTDFFIQEMAL